MQAGTGHAGRQRPATARRLVPPAGHRHQRAGPAGQKRGRRTVSDPGHQGPRYPEALPLRDVRPPAALLHDYLRKDAERGVVRVVSTPASGAKEILTGYETLVVSGRLALLQVELVTGRTHQIRAHLAHIGCPILGDSKYGNNAANRELKFKYQALCAWELRFPAQIGDARFARLAGRVFHAEEPWYCRQLRDGTLR